MPKDVSSFNSALGAFNDAMDTLGSMQDEFAEFSAHMDKKTADSYHILAQNDRKYFQLKAMIAKNSRLQVRKDELAAAKKVQDELTREEQKTRLAIEAKTKEIRKEGTSAKKKEELAALQAERDAYLQTLKDKQAHFLEIESTLSGEQLEEVRARNRAELVEMIQHGRALAEKVTEAEVAVEEAIKREAERAELQRDQKRIQAKVRSATAEAERCAEAVADCEMQVRERTFNAMKNSFEVMLKESTAIEKAEILTERANSYRKQASMAQQAYRDRVTQIYAEYDDVKKVNELIAEAAAERDATIKECSEKAQEDEREALRMRAADHDKYYSDIITAAKGAPGIEKFKEIGKAIVEFEVYGAESFEELAKKQQQLAKDASDQAKKSRQEYIDVMTDPNATEEEKLAAAEKAQADAQFANEQNAKQLAYSIGKSVSSALSDAMGNVERIIQENGAHIEARLQGSGLTYNGVLGFGGILDSVSSMLSVNPLVKTEKVLEAIREASDAGIAYNLQNRAFLDTIADKIANTFDAFDANLLRLIRLQQADTTAARLGMEAKLTQFFNQNFQDTSYLTNTRDTVAATLIDASASMSRNMSAEFEYTVHKWLGSLSSLGMSDEGVNEIAKGLNYLATGDVQGLAGSTELQTMFAMAASEAGLEYSELLLNGLDPASTNKLLSSMVSYLKRIAEGSDNQVVRSAYGDVFNLSMSDMKAISNMTVSDISKVSASNMSYAAMNAETLAQFGLAATRTHIGEMLKTVYDNAVFGVSADMVANPALYSMWKMLQYMEDNTIDFEVPFVNVYGFGLDLNASVQDIMRMGLGAAGAASLVTNVLAGIATGGGMGAVAANMLVGEYTRHGEGMVFADGEQKAPTVSLLDAMNSQPVLSSSGDSGAFSTEAAAGETSQSTHVASGNSDDMSNSTLNSATDDAQETSEITNKNNDIGYTIDDFYKVTVEGEEGSGKQRTEDTHIKESYKEAGGYINIRDSRMSFSGTNYSEALRVHDSYLMKTFSNSGVVVSAGVGGAIRTVIHLGENEEGLAVKVVSASNDKAAVKVFGSVGLTQATIDSLANKISGQSDDKNSANNKAKTIGDLYRLFSGEDGSKNQAHVRVQNEDGKRIQVDTEAKDATDSKNSGYVYDDVLMNNSKIMW